MQRIRITEIIENLNEIRQTKNFFNVDSRPECKFLSFQFLIIYKRNPKLDLIDNRHDLIFDIRPNDRTIESKTTFSLRLRIEFIFYF